MLLSNDNKVTLYFCFSFLRTVLTTAIISFLPLSRTTFAITPRDSSDRTGHRVLGGTIEEREGWNGGMDGMEWVGGREGGRGRGMDGGRGEEETCTIKSGIESVK